MKIPATILVFSCLLMACTQTKVSIPLPKVLNDGWEVSAPKHQGFRQQQLNQIIRDLPQENSKLNSLVIARHGKLVVDQYFNGYTEDSVQKIWSITKAITGTIIGIAVDKNLLSEKDRLYKYLSGYIADTASSISAVTIEHLMTMTSGFEWKELGGPESAGFRLAYSKDWITFTLNQPHIHAPGTRFNYATGNTILLAPIIKAATGMQAHEFADKYLFKPLNITHYEWDKQSEFWTKTQSRELPGAQQPSTKIEYEKSFAALSNTGSGLRMRARDLCKIGQLYLNRGKWNDQQIVSEDWIKKSTHAHFSNSDYGYHWRLMTIEGYPYYYVSGFGLQCLYVFPSLDLVVVMTQQHYETMPQGEKWINNFLEKLLASIA